MAVAQDVADLVAIPVPVATLVATPVVVTPVAILVATPVDTLQEVPPILWSSQALGLGPIMEEEAPMGGLHMEEGLLMEGGLMVHTPLGLLVLSVADIRSSTRMRLACLALLLGPTFETLCKPSIGRL